MKRLSAGLLCVFILFSFVCGCKSEKKKEALKNGVITCAEDLKQISKNPKGDYTLAANIDLKGEEWKPFDFSGTLSGVWGGDFNYTVSNFTLTASKCDTAVGFFKNLTGSVSNINFKDVHIKAQKDFSGSIGVLAGCCSADTERIKITDCSIEGEAAALNAGLLFGETTASVTDCRTNGSIDVNTSGDASIGGMAGKATMISGCKSGCDLKVNAAGKTLLGGMAGSAVSFESTTFDGKINLTAGESDAFVSQLSGDISATAYECYACGHEFKTQGESIKSGTFNPDDSMPTYFECLKRDVSNIDEANLTKEQYDIRKRAVDYMISECTVPWRPAKNMHYQASGKSSSVQDFYKNEWYFGLPYTHFCGSLEKLQGYLDESGNLSDKIPASGWEKLLGNDCSDCIFWALQEVSATPTFTLTDGMICENGMIPVGSWTLAQNEKGKNSSSDSCKATGKEAMCEAYAQMKIGDVVVKGPEGHTRMLAEAPFVFRNEDGSIDTAKSYILCIEQGALNELGETHSTCRVNHKCSFDGLFKQSYVPVSIPEYQTAQITPVETGCDIKGDTLQALMNGTVGCNYRIKSVTVKATENGKETVNKTDYPMSTNHLVKYKLSSIISPEVQKKLKGKSGVKIEIFVNGTKKENLAKEFVLK